MITNATDIPLSLAIWLLHDTYDHSSDPNTISVTALLKPLRAIVLQRTTITSPDTDLDSLIPSRMGTAIHEAVETAWKGNIGVALKKLGYSDKICERIEVNPKILLDSDIPIYMERRSWKQVGNFKVSGKFDFVIEGVLEDFKSTSTWAWIFQSNVDSYIKQGSMYRWLNQDIVTGDYMNISYIFTDWSATKAKQDKDYPQSRIKVQKLKLMSISETENFVTRILTEVERLSLLSQSQLPQCTKEELWQSESTWKYYKDPNKRVRSTKNFDNPSEANARLVTDGHVGVVVEVKGQVKRCNYCNASPVCTQRENLESAGILKT